MLIQGQGHRSKVSWWVVCLRLKGNLVVIIIATDIHVINVSTSNLKRSYHNSWSLPHYWNCAVLSYRNILYIYLITYLLKFDGRFGSIKSTVFSSFKAALYKVLSGANTRRSPCKRRKNALNFVRSLNFAEIWRAMRRAYNRLKCRRCRQSITRIGWPLLPHVIAHHHHNRCQPLFSSSAQITSLWYRQLAYRSIPHCLPMWVYRTFHLTKSPLDTIT